ncbi:MAG: succinate dehydrogenase, cytochrome b556 subunit [Rickettsiales bacterium]|nr:succinate dehydrogenase, cytochrome b556 subunit [Rickettsiales bacterium]
MSDKKNNMSETNKRSTKRPTSPHIQIYSWNISSFTSILHRFTGIGLYLSVLAFSWFIVFYTYKTNVSEAAETCNCPITQIINYGFWGAIIFITFALYYHLCNGIRHLFWDLGKGFEIATAKRNGILVIILSIILTILSIGTVLYLKMS